MRAIFEEVSNALYSAVKEDVKKKYEDVAEEVSLIILPDNLSTWEDAACYLLRMCYAMQAGYLEAMAERERSISIPMARGH